MQAKKPLIRTLFVPDWLADCENIWQTEWDKKTEWHRDICFNDIFLHEDWIDKTANDTNCTKTEWHRDIYFNDIFLHEDKSDKTTNYANDTNYITINISVIREIRSSYHKVQTSNFKGESFSMSFCLFFMWIYCFFRNLCLTLQTDLIISILTYLIFG